MTLRSQQVVGREPELEALGGFLADPEAGPAALLIEGEAGIGKTTLWRAGVDAALLRGFRVLTARIGESETKLSFTAVADLLEPVVDEALPELPEPQRVALEAALLRAEAHGPAQEQRAVFLAVLAVLRRTAMSQPLLLALDDLQWVDGPSGRVLGFVLRRLRNEPIGLLCCVRLGSPGGDRLALNGILPAHRIHRVFVGPMPLEALGRMIRERVAVELPRPLLQRISEQVQGNPFFALEVARQLARRGIPEAGETLPIPDDLRDLLRTRLEDLPKTTRRALLVASAAARPTEQLVAAVMGLGVRVPSALAKAEERTVVRIDSGRIVFAHPLLASTVYEAASTAERRSVHQRLAEHVEDPEERARHLALAAAGPNPGVAAALDEAAGLASARGAPDTAAELSDLARRLTPPRDTDTLRGRTVQSAQHHFDAGDVSRSVALFDEAIESAPRGPIRARILFLSGSHSWMDLRRVGDLCERAATEAEEETELLAMAHEHLAWVAIYRGDLADAHRHAAAARARVAAISAPAIRAETLATAGMVEFLMGRQAEGLMSEADRLLDSARKEAGGQDTVYTSARTNHGLQLLWSGELDRARSIFRQELDTYEKQGRYLVRDEVLGYLGELECRAGRWDLAARYAQEAYEIDVESGRASGLGHTLFNRALVAAHRGYVDAARTDASEGLKISLQNEDPFYAGCNRSVLGFVELSLAEPVRAMPHLQPAVEYLRVMGSAEAGVIPCVPDAIECLVSLGDQEGAARLLGEHEEKGRSLDRPWVRATAGRCRGLLSAARGDLPGALDELEAALKGHQDVPQPFELARTLLVHGQVARRAKRKAAARESLTRATAIFERLGARLWRERARRELARAEGAAAGAELTPTERRIANLVVEGRSNREIAEVMFVSIKTVEANVSRIFHKLSVRSRAQLVRSMLSPPSGPES